MRKLKIVIDFYSSTSVEGEKRRKRHKNGGGKKTGKRKAVEKNLRYLRKNVFQNAKT